MRIGSPIVMPDAIRHDDFETFYKFLNTLKEEEDSCTFTVEDCGNIGP